MTVQNPTTAMPPQAASSPLLSLAKELNPWADGHPYAALPHLLRHLHSTLEVLHDYALNNIGVDPDPIDIRIADVLKLVTDMAAEACEHVGNLETKLVFNAKQLRGIAGQYGEEAVS